MKAKHIIIIFLIVIPITYCSWQEVGPFIVEIKTDEPVSTPFIVLLDHNKGSGIQGTSSDYIERKVVFANTPTEFRSARGIGLHMPMNIYVKHPLYRPVKYSSLSLLAPSDRDRELGLFERIKTNFNRPNKYEIFVKMGRVDDYIDSQMNEVAIKKGYTKKQLESSRANYISNSLSSLGDYKRQVLDDRPKSETDQLETYYLKLINAHITDENLKSQLIKGLERQLGR